MSEDVIRTGRDLAYQGTVLKVYKDHMKFSNGNTEEWDFIHHDGAAADYPGYGGWKDLDGKTVPKCVGTRHIGNSGWKTG